MTFVVVTRSLFDNNCCMSVAVNTRITPSVGGWVSCIFCEHSDNRFRVRTGHISTFETTTDRPVTPVWRPTHSFRLTESIIVGPSVICESAPNDVTFCSLAPLTVLYVFKALKSVPLLVRHVGPTVVTGSFTLIRSSLYVTNSYSKLCVVILGRRVREVTQNS
jgi:hypothetical protein